MGRVALIGVGCLASTVLVGCGNSLASSPTTLQGAVSVQVVHPNGSVVTGVSGLRLHNGDVVRTAPGGRAELHTRSRVVYLVSDTAVQIVNGARQSLRHGAVVADAESGPGLGLQVGDLDVSAPHGSAVRAERAVTMRVGTLAGEANLTTDTGRSISVPALSQVMVAGAALPDAPTPLHLIDDTAEAHAAPALVRDDLALDSLAAGIDATGSSTAEMVATAWHGAVDSAPVGLARSENVLPIVIASAGHPKDPQNRYQQAVSLRTDGGSWGVVAHQLGTDSAAVLMALDVFEHQASAGQVGTVPAALAYIAAVGRSGDTSLLASGPTGSGSTSGHGSGSGSSPTPKPSASPSSDSLIGQVTDTIDKVLKVLPTPTARPTTAPAPTADPTPVLPLPKVSLPALPTPALGH
jgi:hypothetical protein